jgi:PncC family amidohydrolase
MKEVISDAGELVRRAGEKGLRVVLAESCTAGLAANLLAEVSGASRVLWGSYVTYTLEAKTAMIGVDPEVLARYGAVSPEAALAMAEGALDRSGADIAASVTGLAGPDGDGSGRPVGVVFVAGVRRQTGPAEVRPAEVRPAEVREHHFTGSRNEIRLAAAREVIALLLRLVT